MSTLHHVSTGLIFLSLSRTVASVTLNWIYGLICATLTVNVLVQIGDSHFEPRERVRYTRDQLLELREVLVLDI